MNLSPQHEALHKKAIRRGRNHKITEWGVIQVLQEIEASGLVKQTDCTNLFEYSLKYMDLDPTTAFVFLRSMAR